MTWPAFPKRLQSGLKALCCLAQAEKSMHSQDIAMRIAVPEAETSKVLQLLVWGGFVISRRGSKGGFQLATKPEQTTVGEVIDFFLSRHPDDSDERAPVIKALQNAMAPCQEAFSNLTLAEIGNSKKVGSKKHDYNNS
jgi:Rrf2 family protein